MAEQKCEKMGGGNFAILSKEAYLLKVFNRQTIKFIDSAKEICPEQVIKQLSFA